MTIKSVLGAFAFAVLAASSTTYAQTAPTVLVSSNTATSSPLSGANGAFLGTITLTAQGGTSTVSSIPFVFAASSGGVAGNLSSCQLYDQNNNTLSSSNLLTPIIGSNAFMLNSPLTINNSLSQTLTIRCNVASNTATGSLFQFTGSPINIATPQLAVNLNTVQSVRPNAQDTLVALVTLSAQNSSTPIQITLLPLSVSFTDGATPGVISDCRVRNLTNLSAPLNNGGNILGIVAGMNTIMLDSPLVIPAGQTVTLALTCDVSGTAPIGGSIDVALNLSTFAPTIAGTTTTITPAVGSINGIVGVTSGNVMISMLSTTPPLIPGVPNTGFGGDAAATLTLLFLSFAVIGSGIYLARRLV